ncbi:MAG: hypothetical protein V1909_06305, partial [Candidatus Micrarchaeota archaeon]
KKITHVFFDSKTIPNGYFYMGKTSDGLCVSAIVLNSDEIMNVRERYRHFVEHNETVSAQMSKHKPLDSFYSSRYASDIGERVHGNVILVGDSGRFMDPFIGYGVNQSVYTGYWAAKAVKGQDLKIYKNAIGKTLGEIKRGRKARKIFASLENRDFDMILDGLKGISKEADVDDFLDNPGAYPLAIIKTAFRKPGLIPLLRHLTNIF